MLKKLLLFVFAMVLSISACSTPDLSVSKGTDEKSDVVISQVSEKSTDDNSEVSTFEYNSEMLRAMNEDAGTADDFSIDFDDDGSITIYGLISTRPVSSEEDVMENLKLVRTMLNLKNPEEQLRLIYSDDTTYKFAQYYKGVKVEFAEVTVNVDIRSKLIMTTSSSVCSEDELADVQVTDLMSDDDIKKLYENNTIKNKYIIRHAGRFRVVYMICDEIYTKLVDAIDGSIVDEWSNIMT